MSGGGAEAGEERAAARRRVPAGGPLASAGGLWAALRRKAELGDALLLLYVVAVVRQYAWAFGGGGAAWAATVFISVAVWACYVAAKDGGDEGKTPRAFWPIVFLPLALVYAARVSLPDTSYDVLNYHIFQGERSLGFPFYAPGDFFPALVPFNPTPDIVHAVARRALGYRLGTVVNLFALVWAAQVAERMLRPFVGGARLRSAAVLAAVLAEQLLFEINNYMVDLLPLPLVLEATRLTLRRSLAAHSDDARPVSNDARRGTGETGHGSDDARRDADEPRRSLGETRHGSDETRRGTVETRGDSSGWRRDLLRVAFLLGLAVAFKVTNLSAAVALAPLWAHRLFLARTRPAPARVAASLAAAALVFVLPALPYGVLMHRLTGSPLFPMFNGIFLSPYWGPHSAWDARFGPHALWEKLLWPLMLPFVPARLSELGTYSGRITLGFAASLVALLLARRSPPLRDLSAVFVVGALAWSLVIGYSRYGLHLELLGGVIVVALLSNLAARRTATATRAAVTTASTTTSAATATATTITPPTIAKATTTATTAARRPAFAATVFVLLAALLAAQLLVAGYRVLRAEWSLRPTVLREPALHAAEAAHLLRDRSLRSYLAPEELAKVEQVGVWIESGTRTSAIAVMLRPDAPAIGVRNHEHFASRAAVERYFAALDAAEGRRMFSLCFPPDAESCARALQDRGLTVAGKTILRVPYYSPRNVYELDLLEVRRGEPGPLLAAQMRTLPRGGYRARITTVALPPSSLKAGGRVPLRVRVRNEGAAAWPAGRPEGGAYQVNLGGRWLKADGETPLREVGSRATLPRDLQPGEEIELSLLLDAPAEPGDYVLQLDMVHEAVTWFHEQGSRTLLVKIRVEP